MKKLVMITAVCVAALLVLVCTGCGSSPEDKAKSYMNKGDAAMSASADAAKSIGSKAQEFITQVGNDLTSGSLPDATTLQKAVDQLKAIGVEMNKNYDKAKGYYDQISTLEGVEDYKAYADLRIKEIDAMKEMIEKIDAFLDETMTMVNSGNFDSTKWKNDGATLIKDIATLAATAGAEAAAAAALKSLRKL